MINKVLKSYKIDDEDIINYGKEIAKVKKITSKESKDSKLILVTSITPTKKGIGKSTITIGLADSLKYLKKRTIIALREPSLGPVFGIKGGACGGGLAKVEPEEDINLHFTGDFHAISSANNLICAMIDNHIRHGNELGFDKDNIFINRVIDMNDAALRDVIIDSKNKLNIKREESFSITVASEIMAIIALYTDEEDLENRIKKIILGLNNKKEFIYLKDLKIEKAVLKLLKYAKYPNAVKTKYNTLAFIHAGPFANIAHGCNSYQATKMALNNSNYVITEAGFGADLGAEKFFNIKCRMNNLNPDLVVIVFTLKAFNENGLDNLKHHVSIIKSFNKNYILCLNHHEDDPKSEVDKVIKKLKGLNYDVVISRSYQEGEKGSIDLANKVIEKTQNPTRVIKFSYELEDKIEDKIAKVAKTIYGVKDIEFNDEVLNKIKIYNEKFRNYPICISKDPYFLSGSSDNKLSIKDIYVLNGAGFIVVVTGSILKMPGLNKLPNAVLMNDE